MNRFSLALAASLAAISCAQADAPDCVPIAATQAEISAMGGGKLEPISREKMIFARGLFVATPPPSLYPPGEEAMIAMFPEGASTVVFVNHGMSCGRMGVSPTVTKLLLEIDKSI